jgi:outer membrane protein assembly factor BamB
MFQGRFHFVIVFVLLYASSLGLCEQQSSPLIPAEVLEQARLEVVWDSELALDQPERLRRLFIRGGSVYGLTDHNYLFGLDKKSGKIRFGTSLVSAGLSILGPQFFEDDLFFTAGNSLWQIETEFGRKVASKRFEFTVNAPVVRNAGHFYVAGTDRRLHIFDTNSVLEEFQVAADNDSMITSVIAEDRYVIFSTEVGNVVSISPDAPLRNWQFNTAGAESAQLIADGRSVFVSSQDTSLYKLNAGTGRMMWKFYAGANLVKPARVTRKVVYQPARYHGLYAIDKESGRQIWQLADGKDLLAEANDKAYVITREGNIVVMNNQTGKIMYLVDLSDISAYVAGSSDSLIYVGDGGGRMACLKPAG